MIPTDLHAVVLFGVLWTLLCVCIGFSMGRKTCMPTYPPQKDKELVPSKEPFSFIDEPGYVEDEMLKEQDSGYKSINQGKPARRLDDI